MKPPHPAETAQQQAGLDACWLELRELVSKGEWTRTEKLLPLVLAHQLWQPAQQIFLAELLLRLGRHCEARRMSLEVSCRALAEPELVLRTARMLRRFEEPAALERLETSNRWRDTAHAPYLAEMAMLLSSAGLLQQARECSKKLLDVAPRNPDAHYVAGLLEMFSGEHAASLSALTRGLEIEPRMANAHWLIAMQGQGDAAEHIAAMLRALPGVVPGSEAQAYLFYALHHRLHAVGRYDEAWIALQRGMTIMQRTNPYDRGRARAYFDALKRLNLPKFTPDAADVGPTGLIFIVGMFRSGTSLIERVLAGHPEVTDGGETYQFTAAMRDATDHHCQDVIDGTIVDRAPTVDFSLVRRRMYAYACWRGAGRRWLTEKLPSNYLNLGFILHALPEARVIHLKRDPVQTCFSNLRTIFRGTAAYASDQAWMAEHYVQYRNLMAHWHSVAPGRILDVDYAEFVKTPRQEAMRILDYCGLSYCDDVLDIGRQSGAATTASAVQVRQGILTNRGDAWKPYANMLEPLRQHLGVSG